MNFDDDLFEELFELCKDYLGQPNTPDNLEKIQDLIFDYLENKKMIEDEDLIYDVVIRDPYNDSVYYLSLTEGVEHIKIMWDDKIIFQI